MFTVKECREKAEQKITQANCDPLHRQKLLNAAGSWLALAKITEKAGTPAARVVAKAARKG